ncbi:hypothetical protein JCM5296_000040 [Sporobolomyces johnsonii]
MASSVTAANSHPLLSPSRLMSLPLKLVNMKRFLVDCRRINLIELEATKFTSHKNFYWPTDRSQTRDIDNIWLRHPDQDGALRATIAVAQGDWQFGMPNSASSGGSSSTGAANARPMWRTATAATKFAAITPLVLARALEWAEDEQCKADTKVHTHWLARVCKIYDTMPVSVPGAALAVPWAVFVTLPAVKGTLDLDQIQTDPALNRQVRQAVCLVKLGFVHELVAAHAYAKQPFLSTLVESLTLAGYTPQADTIQWISLRIARGDAGLNFVDPAPIADADLDRFVNHWMSRFQFAPMLMGGARATSCSFCVTPLILSLADLNGQADGSAIKTASINIHDKAEVRRHMDRLCDINNVGYLSGVIQLLCLGCQFLFNDVDQMERKQIINTIVELDQTSPNGDKALHLQQLRGKNNANSSLAEPLF